MSRPRPYAARLLIILALTACGKGTPEGDAKGATPGGGDRPAAAPATPKAPNKHIFARKFVVKVRTKPDRSAPQLGYLRAGAVFEATTSEPLHRERCRGGWYELTIGGFVCNVADVIAFDGKKLPEIRAAQADWNALLPYQYAYAKQNNVPVFRRQPTEEEALAIHDPAKLAALIAGPPPDGGAEMVDAGVPSVDAVDGGGPPTLAQLVAHPESPILRRLMKGFYTSLDRELTIGNQKFWRTQHNEYIPSDALGLVTGSTFQGVVLSEEIQFPLGYIIGAKAVAYGKNDKGALKKTADAAYHQRFVIAGEETIRGRTYLFTPDGAYYDARDVARIDVAKRPKKIGETDKWVDVDLATQTLVAYEGDKPVYATLVSTGRVKRGDATREHETPEGLYRIRSKHVSHMMDGDNAIDGPYSIEDVPYVMYFTGAYALHSAFWHNRFGRPKSHGCVNLAPNDAKWLFQWASPPIPVGWHGAYPAEPGQGSWVRIRGVTPVL